MALPFLMAVTGKTVAPLQQEDSTMGLPNGLHHRAICTKDIKSQIEFYTGERCQRLVKVEGVGPLVATAVIAAIGNARQFTNGRELSAWLGVGAVRAFQRQAHDVARHQQARQSSPAHAAHPRGTNCRGRGRAQTRHA
jgi:hypothetical protein